MRARIGAPNVGSSRNRDDSSELVIGRGAPVVPVHTTSFGSSDAIIEHVSSPLDVAADLALRLAGADDEELDGVIDDALALLAEQAGADRTYITQYHDDGTFENSHEWTREGVVPQMPAIQRLRSDDYAYSYLMARRGEVLRAPDLMALPIEAAAEKRSFSSFGVEAVLQVPIIVGGTCLGLVGFNNYAARPDWPDSVVEFARRVGQAIGVALDRQVSARRVRRAYEEAERASRAKDALLAQISHELRTPLHAILGYAELLELEARTDADRTALTQIQFNGRRLLTMVEDLLVLGDHDDAVETLVSQAVETAVEQLAPVAEQRRIAVETADAPAARTVSTPTGRVRQVVYCTLSAAIDAIGNDGAVGIGPVADGLQIAVSGDQPLGELEPSMPLARALLDGYGTIDTTHRDVRTVEITIRFDDQTARP